MTTHNHQPSVAFRGNSISLLIARVSTTLSDLGALVLVRNLLVIGSLLLIWLTFEPFFDLQDTELRSLATGTLALTYLSFGALGALAVMLCFSDSRPALLSLCTPINIVFICWMLFNIALSHQPGASMQRFILTASVTALAFMVPLLPASRAQLDICLAIAAGTLLALSYLGLLLVPDLATHTARDAVEPQLAGDWRGTFAHKNIAAPAMAMLIYLGIYLTKTRLFISGIVITAAAGLFLLNSGGKSATALCLLILFLVQIVSRARSYWLKFTICFVPVILMNALTVGSVVSDTIASFISSLPIDVTFTGRTGIWEFAFTGFSDRPFIGYGYAAFWDYPANRTAAEVGSEWAFDASHSHNSYLELALTIGLPGFALALLIFMLIPLRNYHAIQAGGQNTPLAKFFLTIWLFGVYLSTMETFLLDRQNPTWFLFAIAVAGLHYLSRFRMKPDERPAQT